MSDNRKLIFNHAIAIFASPLVQALWRVKSRHVGSLSPGIHLDKSRLQLRNTMLRHASLPFGPFGSVLRGFEF